MDSMEDSSVSKVILVGVLLKPRVSIDLLSWAVGVTARPNDTIIALHILAMGKEKSLDNEEWTKLRQAKAFVISVLGEFADICQNKQVKLEAKVRTSSSIGKGLVDEAALADANILRIGGCRNSSLRHSFEITKYCFNHAPEVCSVIAFGRQCLHGDDTTDLDSVTYQRISSLKSTWTNKSTNGIKVLSPLWKLLRSKQKKEISHSPSESISEKNSPRAVLDGPEANSVPEDCSSQLSNDTSGNSLTKLWRRLSITKLFFPFARSTEEPIGNENDGCSSNNEDQKPSWRCFSYAEISHATNNFHPDNMVGKGGHAEVYRGDLSNGQSIAVKRIADNTKDENKEREFLTELGIIGHVCHPNTASLMGCCIESGLHLIFELSPNGTLSSALHGRNTKLLEWPDRYKIAIGIARGLHYLHKCCRRRIIHRDVKAANVLLGKDFEPQISDFGLAKWLPRQWTHHLVNPIEGTFGYLAPEYFMHGIVDEKTDVFAFGVLLLEIVTGRRPVDQSKQSLLMWTKPLIDSGRTYELADPKFRGNYDMDQLQRLVLTASYCVRQSSVWRPSMTEVLQLLIDGHDSKIAESWSMLESLDEEFDDCTDDLECYFPC